MRSYGSIDAGQVQRRSSRSSLLFAVRASFATAVAVVVVTLAAIANRPTSETLFLQKYLSRPTVMNARFQMVSLEQEGGPEALTAPTIEDAEMFKQAAEDALRTISVQDVSNTDLGDSCGMALFPCVQKIIPCASSRLVKNFKGELTPITSVCDCFTRGFTESIDIPGKEDVDFNCPFTCVESLLSITAKHVAKSNGVAGLTLNCDMSRLADSTFGNKNHYIPTATDDDPLENIPSDDPKAQRAAEALRLNINSDRLAICPAMRSYDEPGRIVYAKRGIATDGKSQYRLEVVFGNDVVHARLGHLPSNEQMIDPQSQAALNDTENLNGRFALLTITPKPCDSAIAEQLAVSAEGSEVINKQNLPWTASLKAEHEGKRVLDFGLGDTALSAEERRAFHQELDTTDFTPPAAYDARDIYAGQMPCKAFEVLNQGSCGSCYAFAAAAAYNARLCRFNPNSIGNTVVSPQEMIDCTNGCDGGNSVYVYQMMVSKPSVEMWCDPYTGTKETCGAVCGNGNKYSALAGSVRTVGGAGANGVLQMQLELIRGGPGVVSFMVVNDFFAYSKGIYVPSATATQVGGHAVSLVGWGMENGVPYWICQNSWGAGWGENGFFRIGRGSDVATIESRSGLAVVKPVVPSACPNANCANGASTLKDCTCRCEGVARTGPTCSNCALNCQNGGVKDAQCTKCACPLGFSGPMCEGGYSIEPLASCVGDATTIAVTYAFTGSTAPPTQTTFVGIYPLSELGPFKALSSGAVCGSTYPKYSVTVNGGLCPTAGTFKIPAPSTPGQYKVVVVPFSPPNAQGMSGYYKLQDANIIGQFTVLPSGCTAADKTAALASNDAGAILSSRLAAEETAQAAALAAMKLRLDAVQPLLTTLAAELPATLTITGLDPTTLRVWAGTAQQICYRVPPSRNVNPKGLVLYIGDGSSGTYYPSALGAAGNAPLSSDYQGCTKFVASTGVPPGLYTIVLQDSTTGDGFTEISFNLAKAAVAFSGLVPGAAALTLTATWSMPVDLASPNDMVLVTDSRGNVVYWFYTSCKCQTTPAVAAVPQGVFAFKLLKLNSFPGGYTLTLNPGGGNVMAAVAPNWIPWTKLGW